MESTTRWSTARLACCLFSSVLVWALAGCGGSSEPSGCSDCDVTGLWIGHFKSGKVSANGTFQADLAQNGKALTGGFSSPRLDLEGASLSGTQEGGTIAFADHVKDVRFEGTVRDDMTAVGTYDYPGQGDSGAWWASRVERGFFDVSDCFTLEYSPIGLAHDGTAFWVVSSSHLTRVDHTGSVLLQVDRPGDTAGGDPKATFDGTHLWFANGYEIYQVDSDGQQVSHHAKDPTDGNAADGIASAEGHLWATESLRKLHRVDKQLASQDTVAIAVPVSGAVEYDGELLVVASNFWFDKTPLYSLSFEGWTKALYEAPEGVRVSDLAHDGQSMWLCDREGSRVCRIEMTTP